MDAKLAKIVSDIVQDHLETGVENEPVALLAESPFGSSDQGVDM